MLEGQPATHLDPSEPKEWASMTFLKLHRGKFSLFQQGQNSPVREDRQGQTGLAAALQKGLMA